MYVRVHLSVTFLIKMFLFSSIQSGKKGMKQAKNVLYDIPISMIFMGVIIMYFNVYLMHVHAYVHTYVHTYVHAYVYTYVYTYVWVNHNISLT